MQIILALLYTFQIYRKYLCHNKDFVHVSGSQCEKSLTVSFHILSSSILQQALYLEYIRLGMTYHC